MVRLRAVGWVRGVLLAAALVSFGLLPGAGAGQEPAEEKKDTGGEKKEPAEEKKEAGGEKKEADAGKKEQPKEQPSGKAENVVTQTHDLVVQENAETSSFPGIPRFLGHVFVRVIEADTPQLNNRMVLFAVGANQDGLVTLPGVGFASRVGDNGGMEDLSLDEEGRPPYQWQLLNVPEGVYKLRVTLTGVKD